MEIIDHRFNHSTKQLFFDNLQQRISNGRFIKMYLNLCNQIIQKEGLGCCRDTFLYLLLQDLM